MQRLTPIFRSHSLWRPYFVLLVSLALTACAAFYVAQAAREQDELRFDSMAEQTRNAMQARLRTYIAVLRGGAGLITADNLQRFGTKSEHPAEARQYLIGRATFHEYVSQLRLPTDFPSMQGVGLSLRVPRQQARAFVNAVRREDASFHIWPALAPEAGQDRHSIVYLEPRDERNQAAIGFDMYSEPARRAAMQRACDSGDAALSAKVRLKQEITPNKQFGFLIYVPVYRGPQAPGAIEERRRKLVGFVYSPFRAGVFFQTVLTAPLEERLIVRLYDGDALTPSNLLYQSATQPAGYSAEYSRTLDIETAGHTWHLTVETRPDFDHDSSAFFVPFIIMAGLFISALLFGVTWTQAVAYAEAEQTTHELQQSEEIRQNLLDRERQARLEAEEASRTKDEFLAVVSHELRTPLTSILGWASLMRHGNLDDESFQRGLQTIERNSQAQAQLIEDLLDMSRIVSGRLRLETAPLDLVPILEAALDAARPMAQSKDIQLESQYQDITGVVLGDAQRLQQIVWNLLTNAIKFTPKGGRVELSLSQYDRQVEILVKDNGIGMEPEFVPRAFDRFRQADSSATRSHGGLGLGLSIVRHLTEMHGGEVHAESEGKNKGSIFTVRLPVQSQPPAPAKPEETNAEASAPEMDADLITAKLSGKKILIVEDDADTRRMLQTTLQRYGTQVQSTASAPEAMEVFASWQPDILVSDIGLPGEDGYSLMRRLRGLAADQGRLLPALALTAFARDSDRRAAHEAGFKRHLDKPVFPLQLAAAVALLIEE